MNGRVIAILSGIAVIGGCVERTLNITSDPPGALVYVSDVEKGRTPLTMTFLHYGDYEIIFRKDGYTTAKTHANLNPPVYEYTGLDLLSEIAPWTYHDRRHFHQKLDKLTLPSDEELIRRAQEMEEITAGPARTAK